ncbi:PKD domain-containing protein [Pseudomonadota bacterium]
MVKGKNMISSRLQSNTHTHTFGVLLLAGIILLCSTTPLHAASILATDKFAWSETSGWISFRATHGEAMVNSDHLEGYAWAENFGWIRLGSHTGGDSHHYNNSNNSDWGVNIDASGKLSGFAWSEATGWINFNPTHSQVTLNRSTGLFDGYAWAENLGWINFRNATSGYGVAISPSPVNTAPIVNAGIDKSGIEGIVISFSGSFTDPDITDTHTVKWSYGDGFSSTGSLSPSHIYKDNGTYTATLTVTDNQGAVGTDTLKVIVANAFPVVNAGSDFTANEGATLSFSGSFSDLGSNDTHTYSWDFGDGKSSSGSLTPSHAYTDNGVYTVKLSVKDSDGDIGSDTLIVTVSNVAPTVDAGNDQTGGQGEELSFSGKFADPGTDDTHSVIWSFDDGTTVSGTLTPTHTYVSAGTYNVTLTVKDDDGGIGSDSIVLKVLPPILNVVKIDSQDPAVPGSKLSYTITYSNAATVDAVATNVMLIETYDSNTTFVSANPAPTSGNNQWELDNLEPGDSGSIMITVEIAKPLADDTLLTNSIQLKSDQMTVSANEQTTVSNTSPIGLLIADNPDPVMEGGTLVYFITYANNISAPLTNLVLTSSYDSNVAFDSATPAPDSGFGQWQLPDLAAGKSDTVTIMVNVGSPLSAGALLNSNATISADQGSASASAITSITSKQGLSLIKTDDADPVLPGSQITYTLSYANHSAAMETATNVVLTESYDANTTFVSANPAPSSGDNVWQITDLPPGSGGTIEVTVALDPAYRGTLVNNSAVISSNQGGASAQQATATMSVIDSLIELKDIIDLLDLIEPSVFKGENSANTFNNKLDAILSSIANGDIVDAVDQIANDLIPKMDGCARRGSPDMNGKNTKDWITDCAAQDMVYPVLVAIMLKLD